MRNKYIFTMMFENNHTIVNPKTGEQLCRLYYFEKENPFDQIQRVNYYSLIWIQNGSGRVHANFTKYIFNDSFMFSFSPFQPFSFESKTELNGCVIQFHPDFFCIHKHQKEVACDGVLFNNIYSSPSFTIDDKSKLLLEQVINQFRDEIQNPALAQQEVLISYLKIILILVSRLKVEQQNESIDLIKKEEAPYIIQNLNQYIELHYKTKHSPSEYAEMLGITPKALTKITKSYYQKTMSQLISDRIIIEAKRELYLTKKSVKEIAFELGYDDEYYFSRFFKKNTDSSPQVYRDKVGFNRLSKI